MADENPRGLADRAAEFPLPAVTPRMIPFWSGARQGQLVLQRCKRCQRHYFPAVESCSTCTLGDELEWAPASGRGEVFSYVVMHQLYHPAFAGDVPYAVVDVKLAEGPHMISRLVDCRPADISVGMKVEVTFVRASEEIHLPMFRRHRA